MANCKICGCPVLSGPVMHGDCLEQLAERVAEEFCDHYCRWPLTNAELLDKHCRSCPMDRILNLIKP